MIQNVALDVAWGWVEEELGTNIVYATETDERHPWPSGSVLDLYKSALVSVTTVTARHFLGTCSCESEDHTGCANIMNLRYSQVRLDSCNIGQGVCCTCTGAEPKLALVTYRAGLFATAANIPTTMKMLVVLKAREALAQLRAGTLSELGAITLTSWGSMDYSEARAAPKSGLSHLDDYLMKLLDQYKIKRALSFRAPRR